MSTFDSSLPFPRRAARGVKARLEAAVGDEARTRAVVLFACVLALESADLAAVGAAAPQLESSLRISNAQIGLLATISLLVGAIATLPVGALTDRVHRVRLLTATIVLWGIAMLASAGAQSYSWLLFSRLGLGVLSAAAGPLIASLTGDFFAASQRARIYGYILSGELVGAGFGFVVSGSIAGALSWRGAFGVLALPAVALAFIIWRHLPEPVRGGQSSLDPAGASAAGAAEGLARQAVKAQHVAPDEAKVLRADPRRMRMVGAVRYVLSIPTNRWLIAASAIGYFFFAGLRTFGLVFVRGQFSMSQPAATLVLFFAGLGSLVGVLTAGRLGDWMIRSGRLDGRVLVGAVSYLIATVVLLPALLVPSVAVALPLLALGAAALAAPNPPLDAARLDIMPSRLWGRAEGVRTLLRQTAQAAAPLIFGVLADALGGSHASQDTVSRANTHGLQAAFLIMLIALALNGLLLFGARRSYPGDVATAAASERRGERCSEPAAAAA